MPCALACPIAVIGERQERVRKRPFALKANVSVRPTPVSGDDEMLAPKRSLADSGRLNQTGSETKLHTSPFLARSRECYKFPKGSMAKSHQRLLGWLVMIVFFFSPLTLAIVKPNIFDIVLRFAIRYYLVLIIPVWMHGYCLWTAYIRRHSRSTRIAFLVFCGISVASFGWLATHFTFFVYCAVTAIPGVCLIATDLLSGESRIRSRFLEKR